MTLRIGWFVPPAIVTVAAAVDEGSGEVVESVRSPSSDAQFEALVQRRVDAVVTAMDNVVAWNRRPGPADFRIVAQVERTTPLYLFARPGLRALAQLRAGVALVDAADNGFVIALRALLREAGLSAGDDYRLQPAGGVKQRLDALLAGQGDCTLLGVPFDASAQQAGCERLASVQDHYPAFPGQGLVVRAGELAALRPGLTSWLRQLEQAARRMRAGDAVARQVLGEAGLPEETLALAPWSLLPDHAGVELLIAMRRRLGLPGGDENYATLIDTSLLCSFTEAVIQP